MSPEENKALVLHYNEELLNQGNLDFLGLLQQPGLMPELEYWLVQEKKGRQG